jgi:hypothetical protein
LVLGCGGGRFARGQRGAPCSARISGGGEFVPVAEVRLSVLDFAFARSDSTVDVVHVKDGSSSGWRITPTAWRRIAAGISSPRCGTT